MFKFYLARFMVVVEFLHYIPPKGEPGTDCFIYIHDTNKPKDQTLLKVKNGETHLHPTDQYSRPLGRKMSFSRAVKNLVPVRGVYGLAFRRRLWEEYFKVFPKDRR